MTRQATSGEIASLPASARARLAAETSLRFARGQLDELERQRAVELLGQLAEDVALEVRLALAAYLHSCPFLPQPLVARLANDVVEVALPVIRFSDALSDEDLQAIVTAGQPAKQLAIADRKTLSPAISTALIETDREQVVSRVLANKGAEIPEAAYTRVIDRFGERPDMQRLLVERPRLPLAIAERLISIVADEFGQVLVDRHELPPTLVEEWILQARERMVTDKLLAEERPHEVETLIEDLQARGRLTTTLVLRALCCGDLHFFEAAMAALTGMSLPAARNLIYHSGLQGFRDLYAKSGLPPKLGSAFRAVVNLVTELRRTAPDKWRAGLGAKVADCLVQEYGSISPGRLERVLAQI
ncbi:MAG: DUF2336 domain-containing protein, partial [Kiloniellales bacterium]